MRADGEDFFSASSNPRSRSPDLADILASKNPQKLKLKIAQLNSEADMKEDSLRREIDQVQNDFEDVVETKRRFRQETKYAKETLTYKKDNLQTAVGRLQKDFETLEAIQLSFENDIDIQQSDKMIAFKAALKPLEDAAEAIAKEKERLSRSCAQFRDLLQPLEENRLMVQEDIRSHLMASAEAVVRRTNLEVALNEFKAQHAEELSDFLEELETKEQLKEARKRKAKVQEKVSRFEDKVEENEKLLEESKAQLETLTRQASETPKLGRRKDLDKLEAYITIKCTEVGIRQLPQYIVEENRKIGFNVSEVILTEQIDQVEQQEFVMLESWKDQQMVLEQDLEIVQECLVEDEQLLMMQYSASRPADPDLEQKCKEGRERVQALRDSIDLLRRQYRNRSAAVAQWKLRARTSLVEYDAKLPTPADDEVILTAFNAAIEAQMESEEQRNAFSEIVQMYVEQLRTLDEQAEDREARRAVRRKEVEDLTIKLARLERRKNALDVELGNANNELVKLNSTDRSLSKRLEQSKMKTEQALKRAQDQYISTQLNSRSGELAQLLRTYGHKAVQKLTEKAKKDLSVAAASLQRDRHEKLETLFDNFQTQDKRARGHATTIESELKVTYQGVFQAINSLKGDSDRLLDQLQVVEEAEQEIHEKAQAIVDAKRREVSMRISRASKSLQAQNQMKKYAAVKTEMEKKTGKLEEIEKELSELELNSRERLSKLTVEEAKLKTKLTQLQAQMADVTVDRQKAGILEKKLKILEKNSQAGQEPESMAEGAPASPRSVERRNSLPTPSLGVSEDETVRRPEVISSMQSGEPDLLQQLLETKIDITSALKLSAKEYAWEKASGVKIRLDDCTKVEADFFGAIRSLLEGTQMHKRLNQTVSLRTREFDPLEYREFPPEACGYTLREVRLAKTLNKIEIRHPGKLGVDHTIPVSTLLDPIIPKHTMYMISAQKKQWQATEEHLEVDSAVLKKYKEMKRLGVLNYNSPIFERMCIGCPFYPFALALTKGGRVDLISSSYSEFKAWVDGIHALVKFMKQLPKLKHKIE